MESRIIRILRKNISSKRNKTKMEANGSQMLIRGLGRLLGHKLLR